MRILLGSTGKGQLEVLSSVSEHEGSRQKKLAEESTLSKGQVSSNIGKLKEKHLISEEDNRYYLDDEKLLAFYREHVETFLSRRSGVSVEKQEIRKICKQRLEEILDEETISEVLTCLLKDARKREDIESLNSLFKEVDRILVEIEGNKNLEILTHALDTSDEYIKNNNTTSQLLEEVKK